MAVFEGKSERDSLVDDTVPLVCTIETAHKVQDHIEYIIRVQRGPLADNNWTVQKRYNDFASLDANLKITGLDLQLPPKKVFGNKDREFIAERQRGLQTYIDQLLKHPALANSYFVKSFLDPSTYNFNVREKALQHISMFFRSDPRWEVIEPAPDIGWRLRKAYFMVKDKNLPKKKYILSWNSYGPLNVLDEKSLASLSKTLCSVRHPYIFPPAMCIMNETCAITIQPFQEKGSLRDLICKCKPKGLFLKKYFTPKVYSLCSVETIRVYGRQILEALKFLQDKNIPYGHLHAGNVTVTGDTCQLMEVQNWAFGLPPYYKTFLVHHKKVQSLEDVDVYSFGHLIFEMSMGEPLKETTCDNAVLNCHPEVRSVIQSILSNEACKNGLPSLSDLLSHCLFSSTNLQYEKPQLKIPSKLKEVLRDARGEFEKRLKEEQRLLHQVKRISKAKEFHMSDEEKRKRRRSKMKQLSQQKSEDPGATGEPAVTPVSPPIQEVVVNGTSTVPPPVLAPPVSPQSPIPPPPPPPPLSPPVTPLDGSLSNNVPPASPAGDIDRRVFLGSIQGFSKNALKRTNTDDKSKPRI